MKFFLFSTCLLSTLLFSQCQSGTKADTSYGLDRVPIFKTLPSSQTGIDFTNRVDESFQLSVINFAYLYNGGGVGVLDINQDGLQDLFFSSTTGECKLYLNKGGLKFEDITAKAGVAASEGIKTGVCIADVNNDGWQDIYLSRTGIKASEERRNLLFINNHDNTFAESAKAYGLNDISACSQANFFDYDNDGDLDVYVLVYPEDFKTVNSVFAKDMGNGKVQRFNEPDGPYSSDRLYRNNGNGTFSDVSQIAGIWNRSFGLSVNASDVNGDGFTDLYIGNDYIEPDAFYLNTGNGSFLEQNLSRFRHTSENTMGSDLVDLNNDGLLDVMAIDMLAENYILQKERLTSRTIERSATLTKYGYGRQQERNVLNLNNGNGSFSDVGCMAGVFQTDWARAVLNQDLDNDGWKDMFITNGYRRDITNADYMMYTSDSINKLPGGLSTKNFKTIYDFLDLIPEHPLQNYCYRNKGDLTYEDVSTNWGFVQKTFSNGGVWADLDNDGDLDLVINNIEREALVYQNTAADRKSRNWLQIKLEGSAGNLFAIGAKARVTIGNQIQYQELNPVRGFLSSMETLLHFGIGKADKVDKIEIEFPGKKLLVLTDISPNQRLTLKASDAKPGRLPALPMQASQLKEVTGSLGLNFQHVENDFPDFNNERLIPWKMSTPGARIAVGDVNKDGRSDFYIGNGSGQSGALFVQTAAGSFSRNSQATWDAEQGFEDTGAVFLDADSDGDLDLFVASGGSEQPAGNTFYMPRLYLNDGSGNFKRSGDAVPGIFDSSAAVSVQDYDNDGDPDIFLGGWCMPGAYPLKPGSHILQNNGGKFTDVTATVSPDFGGYGMVRDMVWTDLDGDHRNELVVVGEWAPVSVYKVNGAILENKTADFGLLGTEGFWRSVTSADVDGDGDQDLICGNLGFNTRLHATATEPLEMFAYDFDGNGSIDPLMTIYFQGKRYPLATRDQMVKQIPRMKKKFVRYTTYARTPIEGVLTQSEMDGALHLQCHMLASTLFVNNGGKFTPQVLPNEVQIAPAYGFVSADLNGDALPDFISVGNDMGQQVETGPLDAGNGRVLLNQKGSFRALPPVASGLYADQEARSAAMIQAGSKRILLVSNSGGPLQVFEIKSVAGKLIQ
ncbi:MAG: VCBS repeat-containing protein [Lewinellaceae bacterium]|nr:VCBS repeat-containing protein [Lewinellaceae bacterium]